MQQAQDERRQARAIAVEEEHEYQAEGQLQHAAADLRAARQQPVAHLPQVRLDRGQQGRALLVQRLPPADQALANQRDATQPRRGIGQAVHLHVTHERRRIANVVSQVEPQPHQRQRHDQDPGSGQQAGRQGFAPAQRTRQQAHQRPAGKGQDGAPQQR
ncbi:hypothetical protein D3C80_923430 [compost metagenome]